MVGGGLLRKALPAGVSALMKCSRWLEGEAEGILYGGCLSLLCASLGHTVRDPHRGNDSFSGGPWRKAVPHRSHADAVETGRKVRGSGGIIFGEMRRLWPTGRRGPNASAIWWSAFLASLQVPIAFGLKSGHVSSKSFTLPFGVSATLNVGQNVTLNIDAAVQPEHRIRPSVALMKPEAYPSDWDLRHRDGIARRNAQAARLSCHRFRQCRISSNVGLSGIAEHSRFASHLANAICSLTPDLVVVGNAISRGNPELEYVLDQRIPFAVACRRCCTMNS